MAHPENDIDVDENWMRTTVSDIFESLGYSPSAARAVADSLVDADIRGVRSHGTMRVGMYVERIRAGSISKAEHAEVVEDFGAVAILDAQHALGALTSDQAMELAVEKARNYGIGAVAVRHGFHFGAAARYVMQAAAAGCIGIAAANTRPLMAAIGGAEPVVGNNPLAIAAPSAGEMPVVLDMALSEAAFGKIKAAEKSGTPIPLTWATAPDGTPTSDPALAVKGMLLPAAGPKGFGLAMMIDILTGALSGGSWGHDVGGLYTDAERPNDCGHFFLALNISAFGETADFLREVESMISRVHGSRPTPGAGAPMVPGEPEWTRQHGRKSSKVNIDVSVRDELIELQRTLAFDAASTTEGVATQ